MKRTQTQNNSLAGAEDFVLAVKQQTHVFGLSRAGTVYFHPTSRHMHVAN